MDATGRDGFEVAIEAVARVTAPGGPRAVATLSFAAGFNIERFGFLDLTVADASGVTLNATSLVYMTSEAVTEAPTLAPTHSLPPTPTPTLAPTKFEQVCGAVPGDVDGLNGVDITDALLIAKHTQNHTMPTTLCDDRLAFGCGDVNGRSYSCYR